MIRTCNIEELLSIAKDEKWVGYRWLSDAQRPICWSKPMPLNKDFFGTLPFVVEANFWCEESEQSVLINYLDGRYQVTICDLRKAKASECKLETQIYYGHRLVDDDRNSESLNVRIVEYWEPEMIDDASGSSDCKITAYRMKGVFFTGFSN